MAENQFREFKENKDLLTQDEVQDTCKKLPK